MKYIDINPEAIQKFIDSLSVGEKQLYMDQLDARTNALSSDMLEKEGTETNAKQKQNDDTFEAYAEHRIRGWMSAHGYNTYQSENDGVDDLLESLVTEAANP